MFSPGWGMQCTADFPFISTKPKTFAKNIDESHCPGSVAKHPCHICPIRMQTVYTRLVWSALLPSLNIMHFDQKKAANRLYSMMVKEVSSAASDFQALDERGETGMCLKAG